MGGVVPDKGIKPDLSGGTIMGSRLAHVSSPAASSHPPDSQVLEHHRGVVRAVLVALAASPVVVAGWGLIAPRSFFDGFPGAGHHWVSPLGAYDEHLLRDFASAELGLAVLLLLAAVYLRRQLVQAALVAWTVASLPHFAYHLTTTAHYATADNVASLSTLGLAWLAPLVLLLLMGRRRPAAIRA